MKKLMPRFIIALFILIGTFAMQVRAEDAGLQQAFTVYATQAGYHHIQVTYEAMPIGRGDIIATLRIGDNDPIDTLITFRRFFQNESDAWRYQLGNQAAPRQLQAERATTQVLSYRAASPISFWLEQGSNTLIFDFLENEVRFVESPLAFPAEPMITYAQYQAQHAGVPRSTAAMQIIQAQDAVYRTSTALFPVNIRTCPLVTPYHPSRVVLNGIGGFSWRAEGQLIEWQVYVPVAGMYRIALRYLQIENRNFSSRALLINGEVPFAEAADLRFDYSSRFNARFLADRYSGEEFWFYLPAGYNMIGLEVTLGAFASVVAEAESILFGLSRFYQDVIMITSTNPDRNRDYQIIAAIPDFRDRLYEYSNRVTQLMEYKESLGNTFGESMAILNRLRINVDRMHDGPVRVAQYLTEFQNSISALGLFVTMAQEQPLALDVLGVGGESADLFPARANIFRRIWHTIRAFLGSFTMDLSFTAEQDGLYDDPIRVEVWIATGFDTFNMMGRIINEMFIPAHPHITIDLRLVDAGIIFPASLTGQGPDVVLMGNAAMPINFAFRGAAIDLRQFDDFEEVAARFSPAAIDTLSFMGATYALPETQTFNMLFYRTDVFEDLGITEVPNTMQEFLSIVPILQSRHMDVFFTNAPQPQPGAGGGMVGAVTRNLNPVHISFLHQMGGRPFAGEGYYTLLADPIGIEAFRLWTSLYTNHGFLYIADVLTRFRMGDLPVVVADVGLVNTLNVGAPEIRGRWGMAPIPGMYNADGEFRRDNVLSVSSNFIVGNIAENRGTVDASWEFLRWWSSTEAQDRFAQEVESVFGHNWRHFPANVESFENVGWGAMWPAIQESLDWAIPIPQVPGGYIAGREVHNAFVATVVDNRNPINALLIARDRIDAELTAKRREFGLE